MLLLAALAIAPLRFHVDASEFANTVYHVACLTDRAACSKPIYTKFWNEQYHVTREDGARFDEFRETMEKLEGEAGAIPPAPFLPNYASHFPPLRVRKQLLAAMLASKSGADFRRRAVGGAKPETLARLAEILGAVEKRLHPWWVSTGGPIARAKLKGLDKEMERLGISRLASEAAAFLEVKDATRDIYIHAIPSPAFDGNDATANPNLNHFCMEITHDFNVPGMASIALHELTHSLYELSASEKKQAFLREFAASPDPAAQGLYMYFNEAMATAVQLLLLERNGQKDDDPYRNRYIPRLGGATLPLVREAFERRTTLFDGFAARYLAAGRKALADDADSLAFRFSTPALLGNAELRAGYVAVLPPISAVTSEEDRAHFARMHVVRVVTLDEAPPIEGVRGHRGFAYLRGVGDRSQELLLAGRDPAAIEDLARKLADWQGSTAEGLLFTID
jgi:hypothetical protein